MSARRTLARTHAFDCDGCGTSIDTDRHGFDQALDVAKVAGWRAVFSDGRWKHFCASCAPVTQEPLI